MIPILSTGKALIHAPISSEQQTQTNLRLWWFVFFLRLRRPGRRRRAGLNRERMMIGMRFFSQIFAKIFSGIVRHKQREPEQIHALVVRGVDTNLAEIKWAGIHGTHARPRFASVLRTKNSAAFTAQIIERPNPTFITLHNCHDDFWIAGTDRQTNSTSLTGETTTQLFPACAAIDALKNSANVFAPSHTRAGTETPRCPLAGVQYGVNNLRIRRIDRDVATARLCIVGRLRVQD